MPARMLLLVPAAAFLVCASAHAQFYSLDRAYRCLMQPDPSCEKDLGARPVPAAPASPSAAAGPTLDDAIARARKHAPSPADMHVLETRAAANDPRAVEVLAWCRLNGIGGPRDPVAAYWLYRQAADLGVANARRNQITVYETRLTPEQRQQVLLRENAR